MYIALGRFDIDSILHDIKLNNRKDLAYKTNRTHYTCTLIILIMCHRNKLCQHHLVEDKGKET